MRSCWRAMDRIAEIARPYSQKADGVDRPLLQGLLSHALLTLTAIAASLTAAGLPIPQHGC